MFAFCLFYSFLLLSFFLVFFFGVGVYLNFPSKMVSAADAITS